MIAELDKNNKELLQKHISEGYEVLWLYPDFLDDEKIDFFEISKQIKPFYCKETKIYREKHYKINKMIFIEIKLLQNLSEGC